MNRKRLNIFLAGEGIICIIIFFVIKNNVIRYDRIVSFPFMQIGRLIRQLSLSSTIGNIAACVIYVLFCTIPLVYLGIRYIKKAMKNEDFLLLLLSILLFICMYYMVNPGLAEGVLSPMGLSVSWKLGFSSTIYIVIVGYIIIRLIRRFQRGKIDKLLVDLNAMLIVFAAVLVFALAFVMPLEIIKEMQAVKAANTMDDINFFLTHLFIVLRQINKMLPTFFQILIVLAGFDLVQELKVEIYSQKVVEKAIVLGNRCKQALIVIVSSSIVINVLQLIAGSKLLQSNYHMDIPLASVLIVIITMLLAKYFANSLRIKKEMDLFI